MSLDAAINQIFIMLQELGGTEPCLPPTYLFNEGWMLRLILKAAEAASLGNWIDQIPPSKWKSEARLYTPFDESRGKAFEGLTNADGVVGDFIFNPGTKTGVRLSDGAKRFEVYEAKMYSLLSKGVTAARWYDQAARNVACMAQTLALTNTKPCDLDRVSFSVIAPQGQRPFFSNELSPASIRMKIQMRIDQFQGQGLEELVLWREEYLKPMIDRMEKEGMISFLSWEELIGKITNESTKAAVGAFYKKCEEVSRITQQQIIANGPTRGGQYRVKGEIEPRGIVVCCYPGQTKSRVYRKDNHDASYLENNANLEPVDLPPVKFSDPHIGDELDYEGKKVRVISSGPCRCKVECVDSPGPILLVDNHLMQRATKR